MSFNCVSCDRSLNSEKALQQHLCDSPAHAPSFDCDDCDRSFNSEEALQQHLRDSPAHAPSFDCDDCDRSFNSEKALQQHLRASPVHQQDTETPLDGFFHSFPTFDYDPSLPPATSYANLRRHEGWRRNSVASNEAWYRYQDALQSELHMWYGAEKDLTAWYALCRAIGIKPLPTTCEQCEKVGDCVTRWIVLC
jgi:ribosomal protein S26